MNHQRRAFFALAATGVLVGAGTTSAQTVEPSASKVSNALVDTRGTVSAAEESVTFSGEAKVSSRFAPDRDFNSPHVILTIDLRGIRGTGAQTRDAYVVTEVEVVQRRLAPSHRIEVTFPYFRGGDQRTGQTGVAVFLLDFDLETGALKGSSASIASLNLPR